MTDADAEENSTGTDQHHDGATTTPEADALREFAETVAIVEHEADHVQAAFEERQGELTATFDYREGVDLANFIHGASDTTSGSHYQQTGGGDGR